MLDQWLKDLGCRKRGNFYILDEFSSEFYLIFDPSYDPETPESSGTCDVLIQRPGETPPGNIRLIANATEQTILKFMVALGLHQFEYQTRDFVISEGGPNA